MPKTGERDGETAKKDGCPGCGGQLGVSSTANVGITGAVQEDGNVVWNKKNDWAAEFADEVFYCMGASDHKVGGELRLSRSGEYVLED